MSNRTRKPAVAGLFYPKDPEELRRMVEGFIEDAKVGQEQQGSAMAFVAPHAGYVYSGRTAGFTYKAMSKKASDTETFIIIGPNHTGYGSPLSLSGEDWETPMGRVLNDAEFTKAVSEYSDYFSIEEEAHKREHSIEVQLPFIQYLRNDAKCTFLCMGDQSYDASILVGKALAHAEEKLKRKVTIIASSDFNHYESEKVSKEKDMPVIDEITKLNTERFVELIEKLNNTACGYGPIAATALYAKSKKAKKGLLLNYSNSGDTTKDYGSVVSYASIVFL